MKPLILFLLTLTLTLQGISQSNITTENYGNEGHPDLSIGLSGTSVPHNLEYTTFYGVNTSNGDYIVNLNDNSSSRFYQVNAEYQLEKKFYAFGALGVGIDMLDSEIQLFREWGNASVGGSTSTRISREISINEMRTLLVGSIELGRCFFKPESRFNLGIGLGADLSANLNTNIRNNELITTVVNSTYISNPANPSSTTTTTTTAHDYQSEGWNEYVSKYQSSFFSPKFTFTASLKLFDRISIFGKGQVRFLMQNGENKTSRSTMQFPISAGIQFYLKK